MVLKAIKINGSADLNGTEISFVELTEVVQNIRFRLILFREKLFSMLNVRNKHLYIYVTRSLKVLDDATAEYVKCTKWPQFSELDPLDCQVWKELTPLVH
jgi:hypothetical protein